MPQLGTADRQRMQLHLDAVRDLERRISAIAPDGGGACQLLPDPGADPAVGGNNTVNGGTGFDVNAGYSDEETRATFITRAKVIAAVRRFLDDAGFIEVETPMLQPLYGGAAAVAARGSLMNVPRPRSRRIRPSRTSCSIAWRTVKRETPT